jgi:hypothetical protein
MPVAGSHTSESEKPSVADRIVDAVQQAARTARHCVSSLNDEDKAAKSGRE